MHIRKMIIRKLFGHFDYDFDFLAANESVFIFHGPNGAGKTTVLKILYDACLKNFLGFSKYFFERTEITFSDGMKLFIERKADKDLEFINFPYTFSYLKNNKTKKTIDLPKLTRDDRFNDLVERIRFYFRNTDLDIIRISEDTWFDRSTNERYSFFELINKYKGIFPPKYIKEFMSWAENDDLPKFIIKFIDTKRLDDKFQSEVRRAGAYRGDERVIQNSLDRISRQISDDVKKVLSEYATTSQKLDSSFASQILESYSIKQENISIDAVSAKLKELRDKAQKLFEAGILDKQDHIIKGEEISAESVPVLNLYCKNTEEKLALFDKLYSQISALTEIINRKFSYKQVKVNKEGLHIFDKETGKELLMSSLSSGEQHQLYLFADLIFDAQKADIILIDEPEISLHVSWQESFIDDLLSVPDIGSSQIMIATHSPSIIGKRMLDAFDLGRMN